MHEPWVGGGAGGDRRAGGAGGALRAAVGARVVIVVDATPLQTGHRVRGIGTYTGGLLDALTRLPRPMPLSLLRQPPQPTDVPALADVLARPSITTVPLLKPPWRKDRLQWLVSQPAIALALRHAGARLYHATDSNGLVLVPRVTTVAMVYDLIPLHNPAVLFPPRWLDQRIGYARYLRLLRRVDHLIAISEATKRDVVERLRIPPERITVTPLAVDARRFYPRPAAEIDRVLARYRLRRPYFLHVGSYVGPSDQNKNTANILRAFDLFSRDPNATHSLYLAGKWSPSAMQEIYAAYPRLADSGRLRALGYVPDDDLSALYGGADLFVYPSLLEGFGLPILEAMRCACPVLTSTVSSLPEVAGDAALLVDPRDTEAMAEAMARLAGDTELRADLVRRGQTRAALFSWERTARLTLEVYRALS